MKNSYIRSLSDFDNHYKQRVIINKLFSFLSLGFLMVFLIAFVTLFIYLMIQGSYGYKLPSFSFTSKIWSAKLSEFGILSFIVGTLLVLCLGLAFSIPIAISFCLFTYAFFSIKIRKALIGFVSILSGVPSVVFGVFGYYLINRLLGISFSILSASIILSFMVLPLLILFISISLNSISKQNFYSSLALGANKLETTINIYFKHMFSGFFTGLVAAACRILGETMAVSMLIGQNTSFPTSVKNPASTMTSIIASDFGESSGPWRHALLAIGLTLLIFVTIFNAIVLFLKYYIETRKSDSMIILKLYNFCIKKRSKLILERNNIVKINKKTWKR